MLSFVENFFNLLNIINFIFFQLGFVYDTNSYNVLVLKGREKLYTLSEIEILYP